MMECYAKVYFRRDRVTKTVPVSFILNFDPNNWDKTVRYWVFYSNDPKDTPEKVRMKVAEIPRIKDDDETVEAGYYKATISCVADSLESLETMKGARPAHDKVLRDQSFIEGCDGDKAGSSAAGGNKRSMNENPGTNKKQKKSEDNPKEPNKSSRSVSSHKSGGSKKDSAAADESNLQRLRRNGTSNEAIREKAKILIRKKPESKSKSRTSKSLSSSDSSDDEKADDPPFVDPKDYENLKFKLAAAESNYRRYVAFNAKLQEKNFDLEEKVKSLQLKNQESENLIVQLKQQLASHRANNSLAQAKSTEIVSEFIEPPEEREENELPLDSDIIPASMSPGSMSPGSMIDSASPPKWREDEMQQISEEQSKDQLSSEVQPDDQPPKVQPSKVQPKDQSSKVQPSKVQPKNQPSSEVQPTQQKQESSHSQKPKDFAETIAVLDELNEQIEFCPGKYMPKIDWDSLLAKHYGKSGDSLFYKIIAVKIFTADTLLASNVKGIAKNTTGDKKKPGLDGDLLKALKNCLEMKLTFEGVEGERKDRLDDKVTRRYLKDKIQTLRRLEKKPKPVENKPKPEE